MTLIVNKDLQARQKRLLYREPIHEARRYLSIINKISSAADSEGNLARRSCTITNIWCMERATDLWITIGFVQYEQPYICSLIANYVEPLHTNGPNIVLNQKIVPLGTQGEHLNTTLNTKFAVDLDAPL